MVQTLGVCLNDGLRQSGKGILIEAWLWAIGEKRSNHRDSIMILVCCQWAGCIFSEKRSKKSPP